MNSPNTPIEHKYRKNIINHNKPIQQSENDNKHPQHTYSRTEKANDKP